MIDFRKALGVHRLPDAPRQVGELFHIGEFEGLPVRFHEEKPIATPRHVPSDWPHARHVHPHALRMPMAGDVVQRHAPIVMQRGRDDPHARLDAMLPRLDAPQVRQRGHQANRAMPAHLQHADVVEENDPRHARWIRWRHEQRPDHHIGATRFVHHGGTKAVVTCAEDVELLRDGTAAQFRPIVEHHPRRFAARVRINDRHALHVRYVHGARSLRKRLAKGQPPRSS